MAAEMAAPPPPPPAAEPPAAAPPAFGYQLSTQGLWQVAITGYAGLRRRAFALSEDKARQIAAPWDAMLQQVLDRYLPTWAKERPELVAGVWVVLEVLGEIEAAPRTTATAPPPGAPTTTPPAPSGRFPTVAEVTRESLVR